jgi:hypothetical protein
VYSVILVVIGWKNFRAPAMLNGGLHAPPSNPRHARTSSRRSNTEFNSDSGCKKKTKQLLSALCASLLACPAAMSHSLSQTPPRFTKPWANKEDQIPRREVTSSQFSRVTPMTVGSVTASPFRQNDDSWPVQSASVTQICLWGATPPTDLPILRFFPHR